MEKGAPLVPWLAFLIAFGVGFFINEIHALIYRRKTLSEQTREWTRAYPWLSLTLVFFFGMLAGHLWWHWCDCG